VSSRVAIPSRALVGAALTVALGTSLAFLSCGGGKPAASLPTAATSSAAVAAPPTAQPSATDAGTGTRDAGDPIAAQALEASRCATPSAQIRNHPDGGVVFNNAMTSVDAGSLDRSQAVLSTMAGQLTRFGCCFDSWLAAHPDAEGRLMLTLSLAIDGQVDAATVDRGRSSVDDPVTVSCVTQVAAATRFPPSPRGVPTLVDYPFVVGAAR